MLGHSITTTAERKMNEIDVAAVVVVSRQEEESREKNAHKLAQRTYITS